MADRFTNEWARGHVDDVVVGRILEDISYTDLNGRPWRGGQGRTAYDVESSARIIGLVVCAFAGAVVGFVVGLAF